jgi:hypothetical protein
MRKNALDESQPLLHRASRARSCAMLISEKFRVHRDVVIDRVRELSGIDMHNITSSAAITAVIEVMDDLRVHGLASPSGSP